MTTKQLYQWMRARRPRLADFIWNHTETDKRRRRLRSVILAHEAGFHFRFREGHLYIGRKGRPPRRVPLTALDRLLFWRSFQHQ